MMFQIKTEFIKNTFYDLIVKKILKKILNKKYMIKTLIQKFNLFKYLSFSIIFNY